MKFGTIAAAVAALSLTASPVLAQSNAERAPAPVQAPAELGNDDDSDGSAIILALLAAAAIIAGIIIAVDGDDDDAISR